VTFAPTYSEEVTAVDTDVRNSRVGFLLLLSVGALIYLGVTRGSFGSEPVVPVLPEVVDNLTLGMSLGEVETAGAGLSSRHLYDKPGAYHHRAPNAPYRKGDLSPNEGYWIFASFPKAFPKNVFFDELPSVSGKIRFEGGRLVHLETIHGSDGPQVDTDDVLDGWLTEITRRLNGSTRPLMLKEVESRLGAGLRVGRVLDEQAEHPEQDVIRWSYPMVGGNKLGGLVNLDLYIASGGRVVRAGGN